MIQEKQIKVLLLVSLVLLIAVLILHIVSLVKEPEVTEVVVEQQDLKVQNPNWAIWYDYDLDGDGDNETYGVRFTYVFQSESQAEAFLDLYTSSLNQHREFYDDYKRVAEFPQSVLGE